MRVNLTGDQSAVPLEQGFTIKAPGFTGTVDIETGEAGDDRSDDSRRRRRRGGDGEVSDPIDDALDRTGMQEVATAVIDVAPDAPVRRRRAGAVGPVEDIEFEAPPPPPDHEQVVMMIEENGVVTWHLDQTPAGGRRRARGDTRTYRIPARAPVDDVGPRPGERRRRGLVSAIGRKILKVLVFPVTDLIVGTAARFVALKWEEGHAPYGLRLFTPENFKRPDVPPLTPDDWKRMSQGPALLFVHGTFSNAHGAFSRLAPESLQAISQRYDGRVFAFNHHTLSHDPKKNVEWFCSNVPGDAHLDLDIICHSRGALVSRVLATAADELGGQGRVRVGRIAFVAAPNQGTALAHADHMVKMLDRYTNIVQFLPDGPIEVVIEGVISAVKVIAHAGLQYLPGLAAQAPNSDFLTWLRSKQIDRVDHFALAGDFEPSAGGLRELIKQTIADRVIDDVFEDDKNDLVVPTLGVGESGTGFGFPIALERRYTFPNDSGISHTNFFGHPETTKKIMEWLAPRRAATPVGGGSP